MSILWFMHIALFLIHRFSFTINLNPVKSDVKSDYDAFDALADVSSTSHYRPVIHEFKTMKMTWIVQMIVYIGVFYLYFKRAGTSVIFEIWVPMDFLSFGAMGVYALILRNDTYS